MNVFSLIDFSLTLYSIFPMLIAVGSFAVNAGQARCSFRFAGKSGALLNFTKFLRKVRRVGNLNL